MSNGRRPTSWEVGNDQKRSEILEKLRISSVKRRVPSVSDRLAANRCHRRLTESISNFYDLYRVVTIPTSHSKVIGVQLGSVKLVLSQHDRCCPALSIHLQSTLDNSNSDISNSAKLEASFWIKNTFRLLKFDVGNFFTSPNYPKCKLICTSGNLNL